MNCLVILGPTAVGKTAVGVQAARALSGEIISADSRQVYRGLDIGTGKDLAEYAAKTVSAGDNIDNSSCKNLATVPYHLIDIAEASYEYNVCDFQADFYKAFTDISSRSKLPIVVGGTGLYLDAILRDYDFLPVPENTKFRAELAEKPLDELVQLLLTEKPDFHTTSNLKDKNRVLRALEIAYFMKSGEAKVLRQKLPARPQIEPLVIGTTLEREIVRQKIAKRLKERLQNGLIEEVESLHESGIPWSRLEALGLEYRFVSEFLQGRIGGQSELFEKLNIAIRQFAKRQETWFRGMEKKGVKINWLSQTESVEARAAEIMALVQKLV